jgi:hypothetical protein
MHVLVENVQMINVEYSALGTMFYLAMPPPDHNFSLSGLSNCLLARNGPHLLARNGPHL